MLESGNITTLSFYSQQFLALLSSDAMSPVLLNLFPSTITILTHPTHLD